jgi:hypothetical protein
MPNPNLTFQPTIKTSDGNTVLYNIEHLRKFFMEEVYENILSLPQEEKEIWFQVQKDYGDILNKICGPEVINNIMGPGFSLEKSMVENAEETAEDQLLNEYKEWASRNT